MKYLLLACLIAELSLVSPPTFGKEILDGLAAKARPEVEHHKPPRILIIPILTTHHRDLSRAAERVESDRDTIDPADDARHPACGDGARRAARDPKTILVDPDTGEVSIRCGSEGSKLHVSP